MPKLIPEYTQLEILRRIDTARVEGRPVHTCLLARAFGVSKNTVRRLARTGQVLAAHEDLGDPTWPRCRTCQGEIGCVECQARAALAVGGVGRVPDLPDDYPSPVSAEGAKTSP